MTVSPIIHVFYYTGPYTGILLPGADALIERLNADRRERLLKRSLAQRSNELAALRLLELGMEARGFSSFTPSAIEYPETAGVTGKPLWRGGAAKFSISHAQSMAMVAVSTVEVGIDVELRRTIDPRIVARVLDSNSRLARDLNADNSVDRWTRIEAVIKASGLGVMHGKEIEWFEQTARLRGREWQVADVACGKDHVAHVAFPAEVAAGEKSPTLNVTRVELL